jgi:hypothetical protein
MKHSYRLGLLCSLLATLILAPGLHAGGQSLGPGTFIAGLNGVSVSPPSGSPGSGWANLNFNANSDSVVYRVTYSGLLSDATSIDVHSGFAYQNGPVIFHISSGGGTANEIGGMVPWPADLKIFATRCGAWCVVIHTQSLPAGEIGGWLMCARIPVPPGTWGGIHRMYR